MEGWTNKKLSKDLQVQGVRQSRHRNESEAEEEKRKSQIEPLSLGGRRRGRGGKGPPLLPGDIR